MRLRELARLLTGLGFLAAIVALPVKGCLGV